MIALHTSRVRQKRTERRKPLFPARGYSSTGEHLAGSQKVLGSNPSSSTMEGKEINLENLEEFVERMRLLDAAPSMVIEALEEEFGLRTFEIEALPGEFHNDD